MAELFERKALGPKPRLEFHPPASLIVDPRYQRDIARASGKKLIASIVKNFYWPFFGVLVATDNGDGTYCLLDGQHRAEAARQHPRVDTVPVMIIDEMTLVEQAQAFVAINKLRVNLTPPQLHQASVRAGDPHAVEIDKITSECGVKVSGGNISTARMKPGETLAIKALSTILKNYGPITLRNTLTIVMAAYGNEGGELRGQILLAVAVAFRDLGADPEKLAKKLETETAQDWLEKARARAKGAGVRTVDALADLLAPGQGASAV